MCCVVVYFSTRDINHWRFIVVLNHLNEIMAMPLLSSLFVEIYDYARAVSGSVS